MNKGAIFDVDGTLLDSMPIWDDASERFLSGLGVKAEPGLNEIMFRMSLDEGAAYLKSAYGLDLAEQEIKEGVLGVIRDFYFYQAQAKPGADCFLRQLSSRGIPMYLATSSNREHVRAALKRLGLYDYFDGMITCEEAGAGKSDPRIFLLAADRMGLERTANSAGFVTAGVFDPASSDDNAAIRQESAIYIHSLENWEEFRKAAGL